MTSQVVVPPPKPASAWAPLAHPMFRALWIAQLGSNVGVWMQTVGAQWFLVEETHSSALVAWVQTASLLPVILLSLFAGVLARGEFQRQSTDRWTCADQDAYDAALHLTTAAPVESHYFPHKPEKQEKPEKPD